MKNRYFVAVAFVLTLFWPCIPASGQKVWEKKPYQKWSFLEAASLTFDSPFSKIEDTKDNFFQSNPINVRLLSSLPIRQAIVRIRQIHRGYDKFSAADKVKFDSKVKDFLECPGCAKYYIVALRPISKDPTVLRALKSLTMDELKSFVSLLSDKGDRRNLAQYIPPDEDKDALLFHNAVFFFERFDEQGKPLLTSDNKKFYFQLDGKLFNWKIAQKVTFDVTSLTRNAEIIF
jgi:hypothetical protein